MGLYDQAFKHCNKWMPPYKEQGSNFHKCLSPYSNISTKDPSNIPRNTLIYLENGSPSVKYLWSLGFHHGFLALVMFTSSTVQRNVFFKYSSSHNHNHLWNEWQSMCDTERNKNIYILNNLFYCRQPDQHIHLKEK